MKFLTRSDPGFDQAWLDLLESEVTSPFFSLRWIDYQIAYAAEQHLADLSFVGVDQSGRPVVMCPLFLEERDGLRFLSNREEYLQALRAPVVATWPSAKRRERIRSAAFGEVDRLAASTGAVKLTFLVDPLCADSRREGYNYLFKYGFLDASLTTVLINLQDGPERLHASLRGSYKSLINEANRDLSVELFDARSVNAGVFQAYVDLHAKAAGRRTRPERTFEMQYEMILADEASLVGVRQADKWLGFSQFLHTPATTYYASSAQDPDLASNNVGPAMLWAAIRWYSDRKVPWMELDSQYFGPQLFENPSRKGIQISFFKRGFGGVLKPRFRGTKYYDPNVMQAEIRDLSNRLVDAYFAVRHG